MVIKKRELIFVRDGGKCKICGRILHNDRTMWKDEDYMNIDHVIPQSDGGSHHIDNLRSTCKSCNSKRSNHTSEKLVVTISKKIKDVEVNVKKITEEYECGALSQIDLINIMTSYEELIHTTSLLLSELKKQTGHCGRVE